MKKATIIALILVCLTSLALFFTACSTNKIATPSNIAFDEDNNMTWDENKDAKGYEVEITNHDTSEVQTFTPRKELFSLSDLEEGDYDIRIKALPSSRRNEESDWSKTIYFHKKYETGCVYTLVNNGREYEITRVGRAKGAFTIEDEYRGKPVTTIADGAFKKSKTITDVTVGKNVTYVGATAFGSCFNLVKVTFADTVTKIGESCFLSCYALEEVNIPRGLSSLPDYVFQSCRSLKAITIPETIKSIGVSAFFDCESLTELVIPDSVTSIGKNAFEECSSVKSLTIGNGLSVLNNNAFVNCSALETVDFQTDGNLQYVLNKAFAGCSSLTSVTLPDGLIYLGSNAFLNCVKLESLNIPDSLQYMGDSVVYKTKLQSASESATGNKFFYADNWLVGVSTDLKHKIKSIDNDGITIVTKEADPDKGTKEETQKLSMKISDGITGIAASVFRQAKLLEKVTLPRSVKYVCQAAFYKCEKLRYFDAYESDLVSIDAATFYECESLSEVRVGQKLRYIGEYSFYKCALKMPENEELYSNIVPDSVRQIGRYAFFNSGIWKNAAGQGVIYAGKWIIGYNDMIKDTITLKDGTVGIADYAFVGSSLNSVENTASVRYLGEGAFYRCEKLTKYDLSSDVRSIDDFTFYGCSSLNDLGNQSPVQLESVGRSSFYACQSLKSIDLSQCPRLKTVGIMAFGYSGLEEVILPEYTLDTISPYSFYECNALKTITIPVTVQSIGAQAFFGCDNLEEVIFAEDEYESSVVKSIGDSAFYRCYSLKEINLPDSVKTVGDSAFYGCSAVEKLKLDNSLESIGDNSFTNLVALSELVLPKTLKRIGNSAFSGLENLSSVTLPVNVEWLGAYAFFGCDLASVYTEATKPSENWHGRWNASYRPVVWGVTLSEDKSYVVSLVKTADSVTNENEYSAVSAPVRSGYDFKGWATEEGSDKPVYGAIDLTKAPEGTTLYAVWAEKPQATE